jgi:hypothetical protein
MKKNKNNQQLLFLQGLLKGIQNNKPQQNKSIIIGVSEKHENIKFNIEVYPNCSRSLCYRVITSTGTGLWSDWTTLEEIEQSFVAMALI